MAITKFLARDLVAEVYDSDGVTRLHVGGLNNLSHSPSTDRADSTGFDSNGRGEHIVAQRGDTWTLAGHSLEDVQTGERDPGQLRVEALGKLTGLGATGRFRITSPGGNAIEFDASAEVTTAGGGHNDVASWNASVEITGEVDYIPASGGEGEGEGEGESET